MIPNDGPDRGNDDTPHRREVGDVELKSAGRVIRVIVYREANHWIRREPESVLLQVLRHSADDS